MCTDFKEDRLSMQKPAHAGNAKSFHLIQTQSSQTHTHTLGKLSEDDEHTRTQSQCCNVNKAEEIHTLKPKTAAQTHEALQSCTRFQPLQRL